MQELTSLVDDFVTNFNNMIMNDLFEKIPDNPPAGFKDVTASRAKLFEGIEDMLTHVICKDIKDGIGHPIMDTVMSDMTSSLAIKISSIGQSKKITEEEMSRLYQESPEEKPKIIPKQKGKAPPPPQTQPEKKPMPVVIYEKGESSRSGATAGTNADSNTSQPQAKSLNAAHRYTDAELGFSKRSLDEGTLTVGEILDGKVFSAGYATYNSDNIHCALAKNAANSALDDSEQDGFLQAAQAEVRAINFAISKIRRTNDPKRLIDDVHTHCKPPSEKVLEERAKAREQLATPLSILTKDVVAVTKKLIFIAPKHIDPDPDNDEVMKKINSFNL